MTFSVPIDFISLVITLVAWALAPIGWALWLSEKTRRRQLEDSLNMARNYIEALPVAQDNGNNVKDNSIENRLTVIGQYIN